MLTCVVYDVGVDVVAHLPFIAYVYTHANPNRTYVAELNRKFGGTQCMRSGVTVAKLK